MGMINAYSTASMSVDENNKSKLLLKTLQLMLDKLEIIRTAMEQRNYYKKYQELSKVATAVELLDASLDMSYGELPKNLSSIYNYLLLKLRKNQAAFDIKALNECRSIITNIYEGFLSAYENENKKQSEKTDKPVKTGMNKYA